MTCTQSWDALEFLNGDMSPDAIALRLRLTLVTFASHESLTPPWKTDTMISAYAQVAHKASAVCRLSVKQTTAKLGEGCGSRA